MKWARRIEHFSEMIGQGVSWLNLVLILLICFDVLFRYIFHTTHAWIMELEWQLFAVIFLLGGAFTLARDKHVRVDVFYILFPQRIRVLINITGYLFLLIPWCLLLIYTGWKYAYHAYTTMEGSPNPGGLPFYFIVKFMIVLAFSLLLLQGIAEILKEINKLRNWNT